MPHYRKFTEAEKAKIVRLYVEDAESETYEVTQKTLAFRFRVSEQTISRILKEAGVAVVKRKRCLV